MPKQNRVTPLGEIVATAARGTKLGNRGGCMHDEQQKLITTYHNKHWIICKLEFKGWQRRVMSPKRYTELFFLDEATALAAGHRPCSFCSHEDFVKFQAYWATANPEQTKGDLKPKVEVIDNVLHQERLTTAWRKLNMQKVTYLAQLADLPQASFIIFGEDKQPHLVYDNFLLKWTFAGYVEPVARPDDIEVAVLTPKSIVATLKQGYAVELHPSASQFK